MPKPRPSGLLAQDAHRPWPLPSGPWTSLQSWQDLLFAHWRVPVGELRRVLPDELPVDTFDGTGWIGVVPFALEGLRPPLLPPFPGVSSFLELNVRTYVTLGGRPGVYFFSLDAASPLAVFAARRTYRLPYFWAEMSLERRGLELAYSSERRSRKGAPASFEARYEPRGPSFSAEPSSLEWFLAERYCLYTVDRAGRVRRSEIHHPPWDLQAADAEIDLNTMADPVGIALTGQPLLHFSARQDALVWPPYRVETSPLGGGGSLG